MFCRETLNPKFSCFFQILHGATLKLILFVKSAFGDVDFQFSLFFNFFDKMRRHHTFAGWDGQSGASSLAPVQRVCLPSFPGACWVLSFGHLWLRCRGFVRPAFQCKSFDQIQNLFRGRGFVRPAFQLWAWRQEKLEKTKI